jgi:hypothetical protein
VSGKLLYLEIHVLQPQTAAAIGLACAAMGLSIVIADRLRRLSWLTVIEGGLRGRETYITAEPGSPSAERLHILAALAADRPALAPAAHSG